ncbi:MAG: SHOCT domain-containing protein [Gemmataceae bacterium]
MNLADELRKLQDLHWSGALTDAEYARAKERLISGSPVAPAQPDAGLQRKVEELERQSELNRLDDAWAAERDSFMMTDKEGVRSLPTKTGSVLGGIFLAGFGILWTVFAAGITSNAPDSMGFAKVFPLFGVLFIFFGVGMSIYSHKRASEYEMAEARYRQKRAELLKQPNPSESGT